MPVRVIEVLTKSPRMNAARPCAPIRKPRIAAIVGTRRRRPTPHFPIEFRRYRLRRQRSLGPRPAQIEMTTNHADLAHLAGADELARLDQMRRRPAVRAD